MKLIKRWILLLFMHLFEEEMDNAEPEVDKFFASILKPFVIEEQ